MLSCVKLIASGDLNKNNYLPYLSSIWMELEESDKIQILKAIIYLRSPRIGLGEEAKGCSAAFAMMTLDPVFFSKYLRIYAHYCSWKDLNRFIRGCISDNIIELYGEQLKLDKTAKKPTLCAKWIPSEGTSVDKSYNVIGRICNYLGISRKELRKEYIVPIRSKLKIVERLISEKRYSEIEYKLIPKRARNKYHNIFINCDTDRYMEYLSTCNWIWLPNNSWNPNSLPSDYITSNIDSPIDKPKILLVVDTSPTVGIVGMNIFRSLIKELYESYHIQISSFNDNPKIVELDNLDKLNSILDSLESTLSCSINTDGYERVLVLTTPFSYRSLKITDVIWWSLHHLPPRFTLTNNLTYIKGYSKELYNFILRDLVNFSYEGFIENTLSLIDLEDSSEIGL